MHSLEELIAEVNSRGLRVNNLCQLHDGRWQANITDGERFWEFGRSDTASGALQAAIVKHSTTEPEMGKKYVARATNEPKSTKSTGLAAIMGMI